MINCLMWVLTEPPSDLLHSRCRKPRIVTDGFLPSEFQKIHGEVNVMRKYAKPAAKEVTSGTILKSVV